MTKNNTIFKRVIAINLIAMFLFSLLYFLPTLSNDRVFAAGLRETHFSDDPVLVYSSNFSNAEATSSNWRVMAQYPPNEPAIGSLGGEAVFGLHVTMSKAMLGTENRRVRAQDIMIETDIWVEAVDQPGRQTGIFFRATGIPPIDGMPQPLFNFSGLAARLIYDGVAAGHESEAQLQIVNFVPYADPTVIAETTVMLTQERLMPMRIVAVGPNIAVYFGDMNTPALVTETSLHNVAGELGIYNLWTGMRVANFNVWSTTLPAEFRGVEILAETALGVEIPVEDGISAGDFLVAAPLFIGFDAEPSVSYRWFRVADPDVTWNGFGEPPRGWREVPGAMRFEYEITAADALNYIAVVATSNNEVRVSEPVGPIAFDGDIRVHFRFMRNARLLNVLRIIDVPENELNSMETVTRGDFSTILMNTLNLTGGFGNEEHLDFFADVPYTHRNAVAIELLRLMGLVSGESGNFFPNDQIILLHAVRMAVSGLGYDYLAEGSGGFPIGYIFMAQRLGLLNGLTGDLNEAATFGDVVTLVYNTLNAELLVLDTIIDGHIINRIEGNRTLLAERHNVVRRVGTVTAAGARSVFANHTLTAYEVEISGEVFNVGETNAADLFGYSVVFYATLPRDVGAMKTILFIEPEERNVKTVIQDRDIVGYNNRQLTFLDSNERERRINFAPNAVILYNGSPISPTAEDFNIDSGNVTIFDWNGSGSADLVIIYSLQTFVVRTAAERRINFMYGNSITIDGVAEQFIELDTIGERSNHAIWRGGRRIQVSDLEEWDVISIAASRSDDRIEVYVSNDIITGAVTAIGNEGRVYIDGRGPFEISANYLSALESGNAEARSIGLDSRGTFYFAIDGRIAGFNPQRTAEVRFGYLLEVQYTGNSFYSRAQFALVSTGTGGYVIMNGADRIEFNGHGRIPAQTVVAFLDNLIQLVQAAPIPRTGVVIQYRTNQAGEIVQITTEAWPGDPNPAENPIEPQTASPQNLRFSLAARTFDAHFFFAPSTTVFAISASGDTEDHSATSMGFFRDGRSSSVMAFNVDDWLVSEVVVTYLPVDLGAIDPYTEWNLFIVNNVGYALGQDGSTVRSIRGVFMGNQDARFTFIDSPELHSMLDGIGRGDVLHIETNAIGEINRMRVMFKQSEPASDRFRPGQGGSVESENRGRERGVGVVENISTSRERIAVRVGGRLRIFDLPSRFIVVNDGRNDARMGTISDLSIGDTIFYLANYDVLFDIIIYQNLD